MRWAIWYWDMVLLSIGGWTNSATSSFIGLLSYSYYSVSFSLCTAFLLWFLTRDWLFLLSSCFSLLSKSCFSVLLILILDGNTITESMGSTRKTLTFLSSQEQTSEVRYCMLSFDASLIFLAVIEAHSQVSRHIGHIISLNSFMIYYGLGL